MASKAKSAAAGPGVAVFSKTGKGNEKLAVNFATGVVIETDGPGKFFLYIGGRQFLIDSSQSLEELAAVAGAQEVSEAG